MGLERSLGHAEEEVGAEQTMTLLCQIEVLMAQGKSAPEVSHPPIHQAREWSGSCGHQRDDTIRTAFML